MHKKKIKKSFLILYYFILPLASIFFIFFSIIALLPPSEIIILSGPKNGFFSTASEAIKLGLIKENINSNIKYVENTKNIIKEVNNSTLNRPHIGFIAQDISDESTGKIFSLGKIATEPLWIFSLKSSEIRSVNGLLGKVIAIGPEESGVRVLSERILNLYGINSTNSVFVEEHMLPAKTKLINNEIDAAFFLLPMNSPIIDDLGGNSNVQLVGFDEAEALSHTLKVLEKVIIPKGVFSLSPRIPQNDVTTVAVPVSVIIGDHVGIGLTALIANILKEEFSKETIFVEEHVLPNFHYDGLRPSPVAEEIYIHGLPFITDIFGTKLGLVLAYAAQPLLVAIGAFVLLIGIIITYTEIVPVLIQVRKLFFDRNLKK